MLTRLKVSGFKNLVDTDVRFGAFTCIAGGNGVGKSNLFDAIRFLSATANHSLHEAAQKVRDESSHNNDVKGLFHRVGDNIAEEISFEAEMIVPSKATDDLGQVGEAAITFLKYTLILRLRKNLTGVGTPNPLEIVKEELVHIKKGYAPHHLLFPHNASQWRSQVIQGRRSGAEFISTSSKDGGHIIIKLHQDAKGRGRAYERAAGPLPRTVLSSTTAAESPTALCARREMQSWQLLQLEPTALRQSDEFSASSHISGSGRHLAANLNRLITRKDPPQVYSQLSNRLSELIGYIQGLRVDKDEKRELLTLMMKEADGTELPARALSDGTLRFLALAVLELDPETPGTICLEEPENGIHPDRIPAMLRLLQDIAADPEEPADEDNFLRQVIVNTHSPSVVMAVPENSILFARPTADDWNGNRFSKVTFACLPNNWRNKGEEKCPEVSKGEMLSYLNPSAVIKHESRSPFKRNRIIDHPEFSSLVGAYG